MIGLSLIESRLAGQVARLDESLGRLRSLHAVLEDVALGIVTLGDDQDGRTITLTIAECLETEVNVIDDTRAQLVLIRYFLKVRGPTWRATKR